MILSLIRRNILDVFLDGKAVVADTHLHQIAPRLGKCWKLMGRRCLRELNTFPFCMQLNHIS